MTQTIARPALASLLALALVACAPPSGDAAKATETGAASSPSKAAPTGPLKVEELASGLRMPWGVAFMPDAAMLVTEREGGLKLVRAGTAPVDVPGLPAAYVDGQGGVFDVVLHPAFATNSLVYVSMATGDARANRTSIVRGRWDGARLQDVRVIHNAATDKRGGAHFGGRMMFLPDRTLLLTLGDGYSTRDKAQSLDGTLGKILRLTEDGAPAPGNPLASRPGARPEIWTWGHRNVQGIARDPVSGVIYAHEHGPRGGDEINVLRPGANYGWPVVTHGVDYSGVPISLKTEAPGMEPSLLRWTPSIAPSGMVFYTGDLFPAWKGDLLVSALAGMHLRRVDLEGGAVAGQETLLADRRERLRHVAQAPDGAIILLTDDLDGKVLRVTPGG
jgi:glucose/arabinose dehydrogenase